MRKYRDNLTRWTMNRQDIEAFSFEECYKDSTPVHFHADFYEVYFFRAGNVIYNIHMQQYRLSPGDMLLIPPNVMHWPIIRDSSQPYKRMFFWINARYLESLSDGQTDLAACFKAAEYGQVLRLPAQALSEAGYMIKQLIELNQKPGFGDELGRAALSTLLMLRVNKACRSRQDAKEASPLQSQRVLQVAQYINEHLDDPQLTLDGLAQAHYVSRSTLTKTFYRQMGVSLHRYIIKRRMYAAHQLLAQGLLPAKAAEQTGYSDYSAFYRAFVREFGYTPRQTGQVYAG